MEAEIENLKVGDMAHTASHAWSTILAMAEVTKVTKAQVVLADGRRYRKSDGMQLGGQHLRPQKLITRAKFVQYHNQNIDHEIARYEGKLNELRQDITGIEAKIAAKQSAKLEK